MRRGRPVEHDRRQAGVLEGERRGDARDSGSDDDDVMVRFHWTIEATVPRRPRIG